MIYLNNANLFELFFKIKNPPCLAGLAVKLQAVGLVLFSIRKHTLLDF